MNAFEIFVKFCLLLIRIWLVFLIEQNSFEIVEDKLMQIFKSRRPLDPKDPW